MILYTHRDVNEELLSDEIIDPVIQTDLARMNDEGTTFKEIAQHLRKIKDVIVEDVS